MPDRRGTVGWRQLFVKMDEARSAKAKAEGLCCGAELTKHRVKERSIGTSTNDAIHTGFVSFD